MIFQPPPYEIANEDLPNFILGYLEMQPFDPLADPPPPQLGDPTFTAYFANHCLTTERNNLKDKIREGLERIAARVAIANASRGAPQF